MKAKLSIVVLLVLALSASLDGVVGAQGPHPLAPAISRISPCLASNEISWIAAP